MIRFVPHSKIDKHAWDARLLRSPNRLWYGLSGTLDAAAPGWHALIDEENEAQLALPWRRKFGIRYAYQPFMVQQLGPFASAPSAADTARFVAAIPRSFLRVDIYLRPGDLSRGLSEQQNITLDLRASSADLQAGYSVNHRRNLRKSAAAENGWTDRVPLDELLDFLAGSEQFERWGIDQRRVATMRRLATHAMSEGTGRTYVVRVNGKLVAGALFVRWQDRLLFLKGLANAEGRNVHAMHYLVHRVIQEHAGQDLTLDFAGSNDPDLARFYFGFGGQRSVYLRALIDRLPRMLRTLNP